MIEKSNITVFVQSGNNSYHDFYPNLFHDHGRTFTHLKAKGRKKALFVAMNANVKSGNLVVMFEVTTGS